MCTGKNESETHVVTIIHRDAMQLIKSYKNPQ